MGLVLRRPVVPGVPTLWTPASLAAGTLQAWFDAADLTSVVGPASTNPDPNAGSVGGITNARQWSDKSGRSRHITQSTSGLQPFTPTRGVKFDTTPGDDFFNSTGTLPGSGFDLAVVATPAGTGSYRTLTRNGTGVHPFIINTGTNNLGLFQSGFKQAGTLTWSGLGQAFARYASLTDVSMGRDGSALQAVASPSAASWVADHVGNFSGGGQGFGTVNEMVFTSTLSDADRQKLEGYLAWKWDGLNGNTTLVTALPSDHPYKAAPPYSIAAAAPSGDASASGGIVSIAYSVTGGTATGGAAASGSTVAETLSIAGGSAAGGAAAAGSTVAETYSIAGGSATGGTGSTGASGDLVSIRYSLIPGTVGGPIGAPGFGPEYVGRQSRKPRTVEDIVEELEEELRRSETAAKRGGKLASKQAAKRARSLADELEPHATARELANLVEALDSIIKAPRRAPAAAFERAHLAALELADDDDAASAVLFALF